MPVSMACTQQQFESDLKEGLKLMGYNEQTDDDFKTFPILVNNIHASMGNIGNATSDRTSSSQRYFIPEYNPSLFLALAAMSEGDEFFAGEWLTCIYESSSQHKFGNIYKLWKEEDGAIYTDQTDRSKWMFKFSDFTEKQPNFRKATKEEIIAHFTKQGQSQKEEENYVGKYRKESDPIKPDHYGGENNPYEVIKVIEAWGFQNNAYRFNAIKYLARADKKENTKQDLEKAIYYIQREISKLNEQ